MAELDVVELINPTNEDFTWKYNGEPYTIGAGQKKSFAKFVGYHLAKHLSSKLMNDEVSDADKLDPEKSLELAHRHVYDNPRRRIALYKILGNIETVQEVIKAYPFKGFVGEMKEYEDFVNLAKSSVTPSPSISEN